VRYYGPMHDGGGYDESDTRMLRRAGLISKEEQDVRNALAAVQADTGIEKALEIINQAQGSSTAVIPQSYSQSPAPVQNIVPQNQPAPTPVAATPPTPTITATSSVIKTITNPIKTATPDIVLFDDSSIPIEIMADLIFENIGGQELISIARTDTINGQKISYQPIKNLVSINQEYNPNNIVGLQKTSDKFFSGFAIKLENRTPSESTSSDNNPVYINPEGNLVIESINLNSDEQIEIEIALSGTIYETEI
jgi:hypothetical protein